MATNRDITCEDVVKVFEYIREKLIEECESVESYDALKNKVDYWCGYFEEEIEIRIESLKIQIDTLGDQFVNKIEDALSSDGKSKCPISMIRNWEGLIRFLHPYKNIRLEHIGGLYNYIPISENIGQAIEMGRVDDFEFYLYAKKEELNLELLLLDACKYGNKKIVKILLWEGANPDSIRYVHVKPIVTASRLGFLEIVKYLVYRNANINATQSNGETALVKAVGNRNRKIIEFLLENNANRNVRVHAEYENGSILNIAPDEEIFNVLIKYFPNINEQDGKGITALFIATEKGYISTVKNLIENKANLNIKNDTGFTALMEASIYGRIEIVEMLLANNVDVDATNYNGKTALMIACRYGRSGIVKVLIANHANVNAKDNDGQTVLMYATGFFPQNVDIVNTLIVNNAEINTKDNNGQTALMIASERGIVNIVKALLDNNASGSIMDNQGRTALIIASENNEAEIVQILST